MTCGYNYEVYGSYGNHAYVDGVCMHCGLEDHVCKHDATGYCVTCGLWSPHNYVGEQTSQATCNTEEVWVYTCDACGDSYELYYGYGSHVYEDGVCRYCGAESHECIHDATGFCTVCYAYEGHNYELVSSVAPTCTTRGYDTFTCAECGDSYQLETAKPVHSFVNGLCPDCGEQAPIVYFKNTEGFETPYVYTWTNVGGLKQFNGYWPGEPMTKVPGTQDLYYMFLDSRADNIIFNGNGSPQTDDLLVPTDGKLLFSWDTQSWSGYDGPCIHIKHDADGVCAACGETVSHAVVDGICTVCGSEVQITQPTINLKYPTLLLQDEVIMNVYFEAFALDDVTEMGIITYAQAVEDWTVENAEGLRAGYQWSDAEGYYYVTTNGIAAKDMASPIYFSVYAKLSDGSYVYSKLVSYSPSSYAYNLLQRSDTEVSMKAMLVSLLNYGSAARDYFGVTTDGSLGSLTEEQKALVADYDISWVTAVQPPNGAKLGAFASTGTGFGKKVPSITLGGTFAINYYFTVTQPVVGDVTLYYWTAEDFAQAEPLSAENATGSMVMTGDGEYTATVDGIAAKDIDDAVYVAAVYSDGMQTHCTGVLPYSIGTYCKTHVGTELEELAVATAAYGYYAAAYFAN